MGASFRNASLLPSMNRPPAILHLFQIGEIKALAGVDYLTIAPNLLEELKKSTEVVPKKLDANFSKYFHARWSHVGHVNFLPMLIGSLTCQFTSRTIRPDPEGLLR
jgi:hypothetical protein